MTLVAFLRLHLFAQVGSTNDEAKRLIEAGEGHGTAILAAEQTAGRGRRGREWYSPRGNFHCSIVLDRGPDPARAAELVFVAAVALREALAGLAPASLFACKWPNDVLCDGAKIAGMLLEVAPPWVIIGVGVNIVAAPPAELAQYPATSLAAIGSTADVDKVYTAFGTSLETWYARWRDSGFAIVRQAWLDHAVGVGQAVTVRLANATVLEGRFGGLDAAGALLLDTPDGTRRPVLAGDVFFAA